MGDGCLLGGVCMCHWTWRICEHDSVVGSLGSYWRLTYCGYLIHPVIILGYYYQRQHLYYISTLEAVYTYFGIWLRPMLLRSWCPWPSKPLGWDLRKSYSGEIEEVKRKFYGYRSEHDGISYFLFLSPIKGSSHF
ncbi:hypothetical protein ScPMuIL_010257 [Solemya velum]